MCTEISCFNSYSEYVSQFKNSTQMQTQRQAGWKQKVSFDALIKNPKPQNQKAHNNGQVKESPRKKLKRNTHLRTIYKHVYVYIHCSSLKSAMVKNSVCVDCVLIEPVHNFVHTGLPL